MHVLIISILSFFFTFNSVDANAQGYCEKGIQNCERLSNNLQKYNRCIQLNCGKDVKLKKQQEIEGREVIKGETAGENTCDNGLRRCERLRNDVPSYWLCMEKTCSDPALRAAQPSCEKGHNNCKRRLNEYNSCVALVCRTRSGKTCRKAETQCVRPLKNYWNCVYSECIGSVETFTNSTRKSLDKLERKVAGLKKKGRIARMPRGMRYAPDGVKPEHYVLDMLPGRYLSQTASAIMECGIPGVRLTCGTQDISSCICSDGSRPYKKKKKKYVIYEEKYPDLSNITKIGKYRTPYSLGSLLERQEELEGMKGRLFKLLTLMKQAERRLKESNLSNEK